MATYKYNTKEKPKNVDEFRMWLAAKFFYNEALYKKYYEVATNELKRTFENTSFWQEVKNKLQEINDKYKINKGYQLLTSTAAPDILIKSLDSLVIKAYRKKHIE